MTNLIVKYSTRMTPYVRWQFRPMWTSICRSLDFELRDRILGFRPTATLATHPTAIGLIMYQDIDQDVQGIRMSI